MWIMVFACSATVFYAWIKERNISLSAIPTMFVIVPVMAWIAAKEGMSARVEGWAGWVAAVAFVTLTGKSQSRPILKSLFFTGAAVAIIAWLQALGVPLFNSGLSGFSGRKVVSTLGNPGHMGWWMAAIIPWALLELHETTVEKATSRNSTKHDTTGVLSMLLLTLMIGALVFSGSRMAWIGSIAAIGAVMWKLRGEQTRRFQIMVASAIALGLLGAVGVDAVSSKSKLGTRVRDMGLPESTARGRIYIWKVHLSSRGEIPLLGGGPESFQRAWPKNQEKYLRKNPEDERFRSDLRHAHADPIEIFYDFGILGLLLGIWVIFRLFRGPPNKAQDKRQGKRQGKPQDKAADKEYNKVHAAAMGSGLALLICGLGAPVLFFAPTLFLGAVALGVSLGPGGESHDESYDESSGKTHNKQDSAGKTHSGKSKSPDSRTPKMFNRRTSVCLGIMFLGLAVTMIPLTERLVSEIYRTGATTARGKGRPARAADLAQKALSIDNRNPRAAMELGMAMENLRKPSEAYEAWKKAARDLPTDEVQNRIIDLMTRGMNDSIPGRKPTR